MKLLVDAQLPRRLAHCLRGLGFDVVHTLDLPRRNRTPDALILEISVDEQRIVVTKDSDFVDTFLLHRRPPKLLLVSTGNIRNSELEALFLANAEKIALGFGTVDFIEINQMHVIFHS